jgi:hypothetical protein
MNNSTITKNDSSVFLSFRVKPDERELFKILTKIKGVSSSEMIAILIKQEFNNNLKPSEIRKLPTEIQEKYWQIQSEIAKEIFAKHSELNDLPMISDGIE